MINHARTLLLNASAGDTTRSDEEFIPADFRPVSLPSELAAVRAALFGRAPDRSMLNFRSRQLLYPIHAGPYARYLTDLDTRVTYWPTSRRYYDTAYTYQIAQHAGATAAIYLSGDPLQPTPDGQLEFQWRLRVLSVSENEITGTVQRLKPAPAVTSSFTAPVNANLAGPIVLPGSDLLVNIGTAVLTPSHAWTISATAAGSRNLARVMALLSSSGAGTLEQILTSEAPYAFFRDLWYDGASFADRLAGVVLALIYRTEAHRSR